MARIGTKNITTGSILSMEKAANNKQVEPTYKILWALDCAQILKANAFHYWRFVIERLLNHNQQGVVNILIIRI